MSESLSIDIGGMTCDGCSGKVKKALESITGVISAEVSHESGIAVIEHRNVSKEVLISGIKSTGYTVDGKGEDFHWRDGSVWKQSAHNTKWCLIGCSIGDFGTIAAFQLIPYLDDLGWSAMSIMMLAMFNGIMTSIALETFILIKQMGGIREAFRVAIGMSLISMIAMESSMNATDILIMGEPTLTWWVIPIMLFVGFITPWPYNYWRLKKYGVSCH
jgi:copper chaperone CopZ